MPHFQNRFITLCTFLLVFAISFSATAVSATEIIRNGDFTSDLSDWIVDPDIDPAWNPLSSGAISLNPPSTDYNGYLGTVVHQNLNVTGIANVQVQLSMDLWKMTASSGNTVTVILSYFDNEGQFHDFDIVTPLSDNISSDPQNPTTVTGTFTFPAEAYKLVAFEIEKIGYGNLMADNISLAAEGITVDIVPLISGISAGEGPYGTSITITARISVPFRAPSSSAIAPTA
ncbi:MAG: hypothetical protein M0P57_07860 [Syntrophales bacterium]|jgi:hypothetical protein|nr:hypothetical protein [Syntrophales bacterium]MDY0044347.1 hypothetical protein [Syntrophales bacterium]